MRVLMICLLSLGCATATPVVARDFYGLGRLLTNDAFATLFDDRWRTGSGVLSGVWARPGWQPGLPSPLGDVIELRFRGEIISPSDIVRPDPRDRPYATAMSFGVHTHFNTRGYDVSLGADAVLVGPQTRLEAVQTAIHDVIQVAPASARTLNAQVPNAFYGTVQIEVSRRFAASERLSFRPFVNLHGGVETLARIGGDLHIGRLAQTEFMLRDVTTGHRFRVQRETSPGLAAVIGADLSYVFDSVYLPEARGFALEPVRARLRAGLHWQSRRFSVFYGLTYLSEEFTAQPEGQLVGAVRFDVSF